MRRQNATPFSPAAVFDLGDFRLARAAYHKLFAMFEQADDYGRGLSAATLRARGATTQADALIQPVRARYPRHRSFLGELNARCK